MTGRCRFILLLEYAGDDELIQAITAIEKNLPAYDYASRPFPRAAGSGGFKLLAFKDLRPHEAFAKFALKALALQIKMRDVKVTPGYVSEVNAVTAAYHPGAGAVWFGDELWLKVQLVHSGKVLAAHSLTDELLRDNRSVVYLNDVWQLVKGALK